VRIRARHALIVAALAIATPALGQARGSGAEPTVASCENKRTMTAVAQTLGVNLVVNRINAWVFDWDFARVNFEEWGRNLRRGWKWDGTQFAVNMFVHPYHGSLYFAAARANCLNYWESIPLVFLGSWTWEYFGETHKAALNDFYMTGFGGPVLGEIVHRVSTAILDEEAEGGERIARELVALAVNPVGGLNRLVRGQWTRRGVNPVDRIPESYLFQVKAGGRRVEETGSARSPRVSPTLLVDIALGDVFETDYRAPFDVVALRAQISPDGGGLNLLRTVGRLYGHEITSRDSRHRHQLLINQRFDYINNPVYNFGEQSLEFGIQSRWRTGPRGLRLNTRLAADVVLLGAIEALESGIGQGTRRTIDWGPGVGAIAEVALEYNGTTYVSFYNRVRYLRSVSGVPADHVVLFTGFDFIVPITSQVGIGAYVSGDQRRSHYESFPDTRRSYEETRIYLTWTPARGSPEGSR